jgi:hypothetical protein
MAKITSFYSNTLHLIQSGAKSILIISDRDDWNFGVDSENRSALAAEEMLEILKEPVIEDKTEDKPKKEHQKILEDIILTNPKIIHLVYGGWLNNLVPVQFVKNLQKFAKEHKIEKDKIKQNWDFFSRKYKQYENIGIDPLKNKKAMEYLESILEGKPLSKDVENIFDTLQHLTETDPDWIKELGFDLGFDFDKFTTMSFYLSDAPKILEDLKIHTKGNWKSTPSETIAEGLSNAFKRKRIYIPEEKITVSAPVDEKEPSTTRLVTFVGITRKNIADIATSYKLKTDDVFTGKDRPSQKVIPQKYLEKRAKNQIKEMKIKEKTQRTEKTQENNKETNVKKLQVKKRPQEKKKLKLFGK